MISTLSSLDGNLKKNFTISPQLSKNMKIRTRNDLRLQQCYIFKIIQEFVRNVNRISAYLSLIKG